MIKSKEVSIKFGIAYTPDVKSPAFTSKNGSNKSFYLSLLHETAKDELTIVGLTTCKDSLISYCASNGISGSDAYSIGLSVPFTSMAELSRCRKNSLSLINKFEEVLGFNKTKSIKIIRRKGTEGYAILVKINRVWFSNRILAHIYLNLIRCGLGYTCEPIESYRVDEAKYFKDYVKRVGNSLPVGFRRSYNDSINFLNFYHKFKSLIEIENDHSTNWPTGDLYTCFNEDSRRYAPANYLAVGSFLRLFRKNIREKVESIVKTAPIIGTGNNVYAFQPLEILLKKEKGAVAV